MKFGQLIDRTQPDLVISGRYDAWMKENSNPVYTDQALGFLNTQITQPPRDRRGTISSSSVGSCARRQIFTFMGMPELPPAPKLAAIFQNGQHMHLRWQMAGLTEGFFKAVEVPVPDNQWRLSGTIDAIATDDSLTELKSINSNGYRTVATFGPKEQHTYQLGTYMLATGVERGRFIYENKDTQEYVELPFTINEEMRDQITTRADYIWSLIDKQELPEPLHKCVEKVGMEYTGCPFRDRCLSIQNWKGAQLHV